MREYTRRGRWVGAAISMTQHYLCGELSSRLGQLECAAAGQPSCCAVHELRRQAESSPPFILCAVARRALELADVLCWDALQRGEIATFADESAIAADLYEFATCALLLDQ
jgi:hypothetical protein